MQIETPNKVDRSPSFRHGCRNPASKDGMDGVKMMPKRGIANHQVTVPGLDTGIHAGMTVFYNLTEFSNHQGEPKTKRKPKSL